MKRVVAFLCLIVVILSSFALFSCRADEMYDDDSKILKQSDSSYSTTFKCQTYDNEYYASARTFTGKKQVWRENFPENPTFEINMEITGGRFKVVLLSKDKVYVISDETYFGKVTVEVPAGRYRVAIVGDQAKFSLELFY